MNAHRLANELAAAILGDLGGAIHDRVNADRGWMKTIPITPANRRSTSESIQIILYDHVRTHCSQQIIALHPELHPGLAGPKSDEGRPVPPNSDQRESKL